MGTLLLSLLAGSLSVLSPCVLPLVPILMASALQQHRLSPLALAAGLTVSFAGIGLFLASAGFALGVDESQLRTAAAVLMLGFGGVLLSRALQMRFAGWASGLAGGQDLLARMTPSGPGGQFGLGLLLGAVWTPCTGPTLGAAVGLAAQADTAARAGLIMLLFGIGASLPLLVLAYGSRQAILARRQRMAALASGAKPVMGGVLVGLAVMVLTGMDKLLETWATQAMPGWLIDLTTSL